METMAFLGPVGTHSEAAAILDEYKEAGKVDAEVKQLKDFWHAQLENFKVETPSEEFNNMINVWNAYQCFITFIWSRAASFVYCGLRNGYGYRDTVQDIQGIIHLDPEMAAEKIRFMLSAQVDRTEPLYIYGPPKIKEYIETSRKVLDMYINYPIIVKEITAPCVVHKGEDFVIRAFPLEHTKT